MTDIRSGQWVRLPKVIGYAEGIASIYSKTEGTWTVHLPEAQEWITVPDSWLLPISNPSNYPDDPKWNPTSEGHPMVERNKAQADLVTAYARSIERGLTEVTCWCSWTPMEVEGKMGRLRSGEHPQCPVHTKEGFLFGFIDFVRDRFARDERNVNKIIAAFEVPATEEEIANDPTDFDFEVKDACFSCPNVPNNENAIPGGCCLDDANPDEKPVETMETKRAGARFL